METIDGKILIDNILKNTPFTTTEVPTEATDNYRIAILDEEPQNKYDGWLYMIAEGEESLNFKTINLCYPIGSYYETSDSTFDPNTTWGGRWVLEAGDMIEQRTLLWTNPNPTSAFSAQTISIDLSEYDAIDVGLRHYTDVNFMVWGRCYRTAQGVALTCSDKNLHRTTRTITMTDTGVQFTNAYGTNASGAFFNSGTESTNGSIPYRIYGIKQITQYKWHRTA